MKSLFVFGALVALTAGRSVQPVSFTENGQFDCTTSGAFPHPEDKTKFYYCVSVGNGYISTLISCSPSYVFDENSQQCLLETQNKPRDEEIVTSVADAKTEAETTPVVIVSTTAAAASTTIAETSAEATTKSVPAITDEASTAAPPTKVEPESTGESASTNAVPASTPPEHASTTAVPASTPPELASTTAVPASTLPELASTTAVPASTPPELASTTAVPASTPPELASTTAVPASTPPEPASTTAVPASTLPELASTTAVPASTPPELASTTAVPASTPPEQASTTAVPASTTAVPVSTTAVPESTTAIPVSTTAVPESTTAVPVSTTAVPESTTTVPVSTTAAPPSTTAVPTTARPFTCSGLGPFPNPLTEQSFYYCASDGGDEHIAIKINCGAGTTYISDIGTCGINGDIGPEIPDTGATTMEPEPFECTALGFFSNPLSVTRFYYCLANIEGGFTPIELSCGYDTQFVSELQGCGLFGEPATTDEPEATTETNQEFVCIGQGAYPDVEDPSSFYFCFANGEQGFIKVLMHCDKEKVFDASLLECTDSDTASPDLPGTTIAESSSTLAPFLCSTEGVFPDSTDISKFYYCFEGTDSSGLRLVLFTCPIGLVFSEEKKYCSAPDTPVPTAEATTGTTVAVTTTTESPPPYNCTGEGLFADPTNDEYFYLCVFDGFGYISITLQCSTGLVFIPGLYRCAAPDTPIPPPPPIKCEHVGYYADPNSCRDYYYCYPNFSGGYVAVKMSCPEGTNYFSNMEICVNDNVLKCEDKTDEGSGDDVSSATTEVSLTTSSDDRTPTDCKHPGVFPDPENERKYYECKLEGNGKLKRKKKECKHDSRFSPSQLKCVGGDGWFNWWWW